MPAPAPRQNVYSRGVGICFFVKTLDFLYFYK